MLKDPKNIVLLDESPMPKPRGLSAAQRAGLAYERKVQAKLTAEILSDPEFEGFEIHSNPWIAFWENKPSWASPDIVIVGPEDLWIIEIKLSYKKEVEKKLRNVYEPLCVAIWPDRRVHRLQVTRNLLFGTRPRFVDHWLEAGTEYLHTWFLRDV